MSRSQCTCRLLAEAWTTSSRADNCVSFHSSLNPKNLRKQISRHIENDVRRHPDRVDGGARTLGDRICTGAFAAQMILVCRTACVPPLARLAFRGRRDPDPGTRTGITESSELGRGPSRLSSHRCGPGMIRSTFR